MPNGHAYEPVPIREHDAAIEETKRRIAARSAIGAVKVAADLLGVTFAEMVAIMSDERQSDRLFDALAHPKPPPDPADVPVTVPHPRPPGHPDGWA